MPDENATATTTTATATTATAPTSVAAIPAAAATHDPDVERLQQAHKLAKSGKRIEAIKAFLQADDLTDVMAEFVKEEDDPVKIALKKIEEADAKREADRLKEKEDADTERKKSAAEASERYTTSILDKHKDKFKAAAKSENRAEVTAAAPVIALAILKAKKIEIDKATPEQAEEALCEAFDRIQKDWRKKYLEEEAGAAKPASGGSVGRPPQKASVKIASSGDLTNIEAVLERNRRQAKYHGKSS